MIGKTISHYRVLEKLGQGGMGVVYKAEDTKLRRTVAVKFLSREVLQSEGAKARFVYEAQAAAALDHPNICTVHEIDESEGQTFIVMAYVEGQSLKEKIASGPVRLNEAVEIAIQLAEGLQQAHEKGIVHRDVKPSNVMMSPSGRVKIMDFGLARSSERTEITKAGTTMGTIAYMSPEQARGDKVDHRTDIWSLGVVLYEMISGQLPFGGEHEHAVMYSILNKEPEPLRDVQDGVSPELERIVMRALVKDLESRYSDIVELLDDLAEYQRRLSVREAPSMGLVPLLRSVRKPKIVIPGVLVILLFCLLLAWQIDRHAKIRWAREEALPRIESLIEEVNLKWQGRWGGMAEAFALAEQAERYIPNDSTLAELWSLCSSQFTVVTDPPGAKVFTREYTEVDSAWEFLGVTPLDSIRVPETYLRWKIEKEGYETVLAVAATARGSMFRVLDSIGTIPDGMVRVSGRAYSYPDFFMDRCEVTNRQYKEFVDGGGYRRKEFWQHEFVKDEAVLAWEEAMAEFKDATGRPGPATWQAGDYPDGRDDYPVTGVSWYEAAAYAEFADKDLPTTSHWELALGGREAPSHISSLIFSSP
jgi:predicted Ser/Thr protein kinase